MPPKKIIILRHGEKADAYALCSTGQRRSIALAEQYLGKNPSNALFQDDTIDAFFAVTLHTIELAAPSAQSWGLPVRAYTAVPIDAAYDDPKNPYGVSQVVLDTRTKEAVKDVQRDKWKDKTIVMVWEHKHIAHKDQAESLRNLLGLKDAPDSWHGENFDYFWIVTYDKSGKPVFQSVKQTYDGAFHDLPQNDWGVPPTGMGTDCKSPSS